MSVSMWEVRVAALMPSASVRKYSCGFVDMFHTRVTIPFAIPSSEGFNAHNTTSGFDTDANEYLVSGRPGPGFASPGLTAAATSGF